MKVTDVKNGKAPAARTPPPARKAEPPPDMENLPPAGVPVRPPGRRRPDAAVGRGDAPATEVNGDPDRNPHSAVPDTKGSGSAPTTGAERLRRTLIPGAMASALGVEDLFNGVACLDFVGTFLAEAGSPSDPVERLLLEQMVLAHVRLTRLSTAAANAEATEAVRVLNHAASRLLGEVSKLALALKSYRLPAGVVKDNSPVQQRRGQSRQEKVP